MEDDTLLGGLKEDDLVDDAEIDTMVRESVSATVGDAQFLHAKIDTWANNVVEGCLKRLAALSKPFKYVVTCNLTQKAGAGGVVAASPCMRRGSTRRTALQRLHGCPASGLCLGAHG